MTEAVWKPIELVGCRPSLLTKAAIQAAYSLNVGNLCDTGYSAEATPPAAMAELESLPASVPNSCSFFRIRVGVERVLNIEAETAHRPALACPRSAFKGRNSGILQ